MALKFVLPVVKLGVLFLVASPVHQMREPEDDSEYGEARLHANYFIVFIPKFSFFQLDLFRSSFTFSLSKYLLLPAKCLESSKLTSVVEDMSRISLAQHFRQSFGLFSLLKLLL